MVRVGNYSQGGTGRPEVVTAVQTVRLVDSTAGTSGELSPGS